MSPALAGIARTIVGVSNINTGLFAQPITVAGGTAFQVVVEVDSATGTFLAGGGFTPIPPDLSSSYRSALGFLLSVWWLPGATSEAHFITIEQAANGGSAWGRVRKDLVEPGVPYFQRGIPIGASFARVTVGNTQVGNLTGDLSIRATTL